MPDRLVIVGAGQAAYSTIATLRKSAPDVSITLIGDESHAPYQRPPLSKKFLAGTMASEQLSLRPITYYSQQRVDTRFGSRAVLIDRKRRSVSLANGEMIGYDKLVLALGAGPRRIELPGIELPGVHYLRSQADVAAIRAQCAAGRRAVIIGGGYIGLEVAATVRKLGLEVTVLESADRVMQRVVSDPVSRSYEAEHARHGVRIVLNAAVHAILGDTSVTGVRCAGEQDYLADFVVVGIGCAPSVLLAADAGLECDNGIRTDAQGRTSDPDIFAAGDCANSPRSRYGRSVRLESVDNAIEQANVVCAALLGNAEPKEHLPWFWSDQYERKLVIVGLPHDHDALVTRGRPEEGSFSVCYMRGRQLVAIETVNSPRDQMAARQLIAARTELDLARVADGTVPLKECA
jgi:3-phenylpropionate/trans-cinnamate dioxygenase ferredoxin reductase subunit